MICVIGLCNFGCNRICAIFCVYVPDFVFLFSGEVNLDPWKTEVAQIALAPYPGVDSPEGTLVLAANRTNRPDILQRFRRYKGGWDIANRHYWAVSTMIHIHHVIKFLIHYLFSCCQIDNYIDIQVCCLESPGEHIFGLLG